MTVLFSKGLPRSVRDVEPGYTRWGAAPGSPGMIANRYRTMVYEQIYREQPAVFSVLNRLLMGICRVPIKAYRYGPDGNSRSRERDHPVAKLIKQPWKGHAQWELKERIGFDLLLHGRALAWKLRPGPGRPPTEVWPIPWRSVLVLSDARGVLAYLLYLDGAIYTLAPEDCVYMELVGGGTSPIEPLRRTIGVEDCSLDWQVEALSAGFSARAVYTTPINVADDRKMRAARASIEQAYSGPKGKQFAVLGENSDVKVLPGLSATDIGIIQARQAAREDVCACYNVQPSVLGFSTTGQPVNYASAREWRKAFYVDGVGPLLTMFEEFFNSQVIVSEPMWSDIFVSFDTTELLMPDAVDLARADLMDMQSMTTTSNERRQRRNEAPIGDPDDPDNPHNQLWVPANGQIVGSEPIDLSDKVKDKSNASRESLVEIAAGFDDKEGEKND